MRSPFLEKVWRFKVGTSLSLQPVQDYPRITFKIDVWISTHMLISRANSSGYQQSISLEHVQKFEKCLLRYPHFP